MKSVQIPPRNLFRIPESNWNPTVVPDGTATFDGQGNGITTVNITDGGNFPISDIVFNTSNSAGYTFVATNSQNRFFTSDQAAITINSRVVNSQNFLAPIAKIACSQQKIPQAQGNARKC